MRVIKFLDESAVPYDVTDHAPTFTAQQMAAAEHEPGKYVAKPVIVKVDGKYMMCVLAACYKIDLGELKRCVERLRRTSNSLLLSFTRLLYSAHTAFVATALPMIAEIMSESGIRE